MPYYPPPSVSDATKLPLAGGTMTGTITSAVGTITTNTPALDVTQTWNASGVSFAAIKVNVTNTASASASRLIDLQVGGSSKFSVDTGGILYAVRSRIQYYLSTNSAFELSEANGLIMPANKLIRFATNNFGEGNSGDIGLGRNAAGVLEINNGTAGTFRDLKLRDLIMTSGASSVIIPPTADPHVSGAIWNNSGTLAISAG